MKRAQNSPRAAGTATRSLFERLNERTDSEHEQALVRIGIGVFIMAYLITLGLIYGFTNPAVQYPKFIAIGGIARFIFQSSFSGTSCSLELKASSQVTSCPV